jgi:hypothetical protein
VWNGIENVQLHIVSIPNGNIPLKDEHVVFLLTQTSWLWRCYSLDWHITFGCEHVVFIHLNFTSISNFHPLYCSSIYTWKNIPPRHDIFYAMCQRIFFQYSFNVSKIFLKRFILAHPFMFTYSHSCSHVHHLASLITLPSLWIRVRDFEALSFF